jgi:polyphosphate kinase 2 (PPK2 family)
MATTIEPMEKALKRFGHSSVTSTGVVERQLRVQRPDCPTGRQTYELSAVQGYLTENGIRVVKVLLNISKEEQRTRFLRRLDLPDHTWKFSAADIKERAYWDDYQHAFSEMLSATSTDWAPWYVIPANRKWFAHISVGAVLVHALAEIDPQYPTVDANEERDQKLARETLQADAPGGTPT